MEEAPRTAAGDAAAMIGGAVQPRARTIARGRPAGQNVSVALKRASRGDMIAVGFSQLAPLFE